MNHIESLPLTDELVASFVDTNWAEMSTRANSLPEQRQETITQSTVFYKLEGCDRCDAAPIQTTLAYDQPATGVVRVIFEALNGEVQWNMAHSLFVELVENAQPLERIYSSDVIAWHEAISDTPDTIRAYFQLWASEDEEVLMSVDYRDVINFVTATTGRAQLLTSIDGDAAKSATVVADIMRADSKLVRDRIIGVLSKPSQLSLHQLYDEAHEIFEHPTKLDTLIAALRTVEKLQATLPAQQLGIAEPSSLEIPDL